MNQSIEKSSRLRLHYLDGLRGLAALYVVLVHIEPEIGATLPLFWSLFGKTLRYGGFAVAIFIALSGYVLMLPVSRSQSGYISGTLVDYIKRRSRRILPPYYAALLFSLLLAFAIFLLERFSGFEWNQIAGKGPFSPEFTFIDVLSHLLLVHNLSNATHMSINPPMWSVATEWQIYFIFPIILLPVWRRFGLLASIITAFAISLLPLYLLNGLFEAASPWYLGVFALGMGAAEIGFSTKPKLVAMRISLPWGTLTVVFIIIAFITEWRKLGLHIWIGHSFFGIASACLFIYCTKFIIDGKKGSLILNIFEHPLAVDLGTISYSLYLTHGPVLSLVRYGLFNLQLPASTFATASYLLGTIASLLFAYPFYLLFERPFMSNFLQKRKLQDTNFQQPNNTKKL
ncbi:acyltransferase [Aetokthonos hydrillicola Thurmond2011]|jgi:peptidoglycan/LPS O-acetylase OafA/YrhL|uniref:Acyltransferase n=1 Tax=Aetokthonos hydrillicola Thurmond2011 TaxID=2712845 RepID=A0AAP5MBF4_9CYAN|nr:acyltransferase [Aetokthonos hydrillicola]MBO3458408.1 acyltransferase [Aetokthonos hydrillicola CCALA 1050]MBW4586265.1 acyltransferase [Aetokthonos hydrillicola CCALA 1050]MDR9897872.1 acyltransferase [Aetokthonos hydrillicola Thurmond2011]